MNRSKKMIKRKQRVNVPAKLECSESRNELLAVQSQINHLLFLRQINLNVIEPLRIRG